MIKHPNYKCDFNAFILLGRATAVITELLYGLWLSAFDDDKRYHEDGTPKIPKTEGPLFPKKIFICTTSTINAELEGGNKALLEDKLKDFFSIYGEYQENGESKKAEVPELDVIVLHKLDKTNSRGPEAIPDSVGLKKYELEESVLFELKNIKGFFDSKHCPVPFVFCLTGARSAISQAAASALSIVIEQNDCIFDVQTSSSPFIQKFWFPYPKSDKANDCLGKDEKGVEHLSSEISIDLTEQMVPPLAELLFASDDQTKYREQIATLNVRDVYLLSRIQVLTAKKSAEVKLGAFDESTNKAIISIPVEGEDSYTIEVGPAWPDIRAYLAYRYFIRHLQIHDALKTQFRPFNGTNYNKYTFAFTFGDQVDMVERDFHTIRAKYVTKATFYELLHALKLKKKWHTNHKPMPEFSDSIRLADAIQLINSKYPHSGKETGVVIGDGERSMMQNFGLLLDYSGNKDNSVKLSLDMDKKISTPMLINASYVSHFHKMLRSKLVPEFVVKQLEINFKKDSEGFDLEYNYAACSYPLSQFVIKDINSDNMEEDFDPNSESAKAVFSEFKIK